MRPPWAGVFEWTVPQSTPFGEYELEAVAIDNDDDQKTITQKLKIENKLPAITVNLADGEAIEHGYTVAISAVDTDDAVTKLILKLDGNKHLPAADYLYRKDSW